MGNCTLAKKKKKKEKGYTLSRIEGSVHLVAVINKPHISEEFCTSIWKERMHSPIEYWIIGRIKENYIIPFGSSTNWSEQNNQLSSTKHNSLPSHWRKETFSTQWATVAPASGVRLPAHPKRPVGCPCIMFSASLLLIQKSKPSNLLQWNWKTSPQRDWALPGCWAQAEVSAISQSEFQGLDSLERNQSIQGTQSPKQSS